jgi:cytoskeletal protein CcmA (bactofilin family)
MKKLIAIVSAVIVTSLLLVGGVVLASDKPNERFQDNVMLKESDVIDGSYYAAGQTVTIAGTVKGDVYCAGKNIIVSGIIEGDVLCAGQTVKVSGTVAGDVRLAGQFVTVDGKVAKSASVFGSTVDITRSARIGMDMNGAGESVTVDGDVARDVVLAGNAVTLTGTLGRNVEATSENLTVADGASVAGKLHYTSRNEASIASGSVKGQVDFTKRTQEDGRRNSNTWFASSALFMMLAFLVIALALALVAPQFVNEVGVTGQKRLGMSILAGVVFLFAAPIIVVMVAITLVGIPLAAIMLLAWILILLLSGPFVAYYIGRLVLRRNSNNIVAAMMTGAVILAILYVIPIVNIIAGFAATILGSGMLSLHLMSGRKKFSYSIKQ